jgi:hypothetical protein
MHGLGYAAALVLACVFLAAAVTKLTDRDATAESFRALGLPPAIATMVPWVELALAAGLVLVPEWSAAFALAVLAAFTTFVARAVRHGVIAPCNCFGGSASAPLSVVTILRNLLLAVAAGVALTASGPTLPSAGAVLVTAGALAAATATLVTASASRVGRSR